MSERTWDRFVLLFLRLAMGWIFLREAAHLFGDPRWSTADIFRQSVTFNGLFAWFIGPSMTPFMDFLARWAYLFVGASYLTGFALRASEPVGVAILAITWATRLDFPYVGGRESVVIDHNVVYAIIVIFLVVKRAGLVWGLDAIVARNPGIRNNPATRWIFSAE